MTTDNLDFLEAKAKELFEKRDKLNDERGSRKKERDQLNESVKSLQEKAKRSKSERDSVNEKVANCKRKLRNLREHLESKQEKSSEIGIKLSENRKNLRPRRRLLEELKEIEWELSTTPTLEIKNRENELIDRAKFISSQIEEHRRLDTQDDIYLMSLADSKAVGIEIQRIRSRMNELHEVGQKHHEQMIAFYKNADNERKRSDEAHRKYLDTLESLEEVNRKLDETLTELRKLRKLSNDEARIIAEKRDMILEEKKKLLIAKAKRKLETGEKLSLEEMKLIYGES
jgi:uncharacterized coiled-coil DUF342 family protein